METDDDRGGAWSSLVLLERYRDGDDRAAAEIFDRYVARLTALARSWLSPRLTRRTDPEDVVQSVYRSFFLEAREGRFVLGRGGDLWRLLAGIARHKLSRQARRQTADRRSIDVEVPLGRVEFASPRHEPTPEDAVALTDELEWLFARLDPFDRRVLELRLQGQDLEEIASNTGRAERSVRRALARVREIVTARQRALEQFGEETVEVEPGMPPLSHRGFLLQRLLGAGRMGKVYEARQHATGSQVAVKFLRKSLLDHPGVVRRFIAEARTVARLRHPHIVGTQGLGRTPGGSYFIVMDLVAGPDLARIAGQRIIGVDEALWWTLQACDALAHAHERAIVHCDLKPANLLLDENGSLRITDFGLARSLAEELPWAAEIEGTAPFMAPEQASRSWGPIDVRTDVYGLGAVLYALLAGRPPFVGRRLGEILSLVVSPVPVVPPVEYRPGLPDAVDALCRKCLAKDPAARFATIQEVRSALSGPGMPRIPSG
jgi:RNA polymerase sigma factor (sigma-70 family)